MALKDVRQRAGLSQKQLAEVSGVNVRMIQNYEQGSKDINKAHLNTLLRLCDALNCGLSDIITDAETADLLHRLNL